MNKYRYVNRNLSQARAEQKCFNRCNHVVLHFALGGIPFDPTLQESVTVEAKECKRAQEANGTL
jgi:hypothetical protein